MSRARCSFVSRWDGEDDPEELALMAQDIGRIVSIRSEMLKPATVKGASLINNNSNSSTTPAANSGGAGNEDPTLGAEESARLCLVVERACKTTPDLIPFTYTLSEVTLSYLKDLLSERQLDLAEAKKTKQSQEAAQQEEASTVQEDVAVLQEDIQLLSLSLTLGAAILSTSTGASARSQHMTHHKGRRDSHGRNGETSTEVVAAESEEEGNGSDQDDGDDVRNFASFEEDLEMSATGESSGVRGIVHRKLRPLQNDNTIMRNAIGFKPGEKVTAVSVATKLKALGFGATSGANGSMLAITEGGEQNQSQAQSHAGNNSSVNNGKKSDAKKQKLAQKPKPNANDGVSNVSGVPGNAGGPDAAPLSYNMDADTSHSPLAWDMETEAAINARTRYDPYKKRRAAGEDARQLDAVTQQQLVSRLHDKSVDLKEKRKKDNEEMVKRELGRHERRILSSDEQTELGARLHDRWGAHVKDRSEKLKENYLRPLSPERKLDPETQKAMAQRLHDECKAKTKADMEKLVNKYITETELPKTKLKKQQQLEMADRLSVYNVRDYNGSK